MRNELSTLAARGLSLRVGREVYVRADRRIDYFFTRQAIHEPPMEKRSILPSLSSIFITRYILRCSSTPFSLKKFISPGVSMPSTPANSIASRIVAMATLIPRLAASSCTQRAEKIPEPLDLIPGLEFAPEYD